MRNYGLNLIQVYVQVFFVFQFNMYATKISISVLSDLLQWTGTTRNLRHHDAFLLKMSKTRLVTFGDKAFSNAGPKLWNSLPYDIRCIDSVDIFKSRLKTYLFRQAFEM